MSTSVVPTRTVTATAVRQQSSDAQTWAELVKAIDAEDGVALVPMETLRRLEGAQRLGVHVLKAIGARLGTLGLGHMPETLPNRQDQEAILYRYGTPASEVIAAVRNGLTSPQDVKNTYQALHKLNTAPETTEIVHRADMEQSLTTAAEAVLSLLGPTGRNGLMNGMLDSIKSR